MLFMIAIVVEHISLDGLKGFKSLSLPLSLIGDRSLLSYHLSLPGSRGAVSFVILDTSDIRIWL